MQLNPFKKISEQAAGIKGISAVAAGTAGGLLTAGGNLAHRIANRKEDLKIKVNLEQQAAFLLQL